MPTSNHRDLSIVVRFLAAAASLPASCAGRHRGHCLLKRRAAAAESPPLEPGSVMLFQGDSITDAGRDRKANGPNDCAGLGTRLSLPARRGTCWPTTPRPQLKVYNRGISGNKVPDLAARWQEDCVDLKPDVLSILDRRERHLAQARRPLRRHRRGLRDRLPRAARAHAQGDLPACGS